MQANGKLQLTTFHLDELKYGQDHGISSGRDSEEAVNG